MTLAADQILPKKSSAKPRAKAADLPAGRAAARRRPPAIG